MEYSGECRVREKVSAGRMGRFILLSVIFAVTMALGLTKAPLLGVAAIICGVIWWFALRGLRREYEYTATPDEILIDCIIGRRRRRHMIVIPLSVVTLYAPEDDSALAAYRHEGVRWLDFSSGREEDRHGVLICKRNGRTTAVAFTTDEEMHAAMLRQFGEENGPGSRRGTAD